MLALGTRFAEADCSSWDARFTFQDSAGAADPDRHRPRGDRPQLSGRARRGRRPEAGAARAAARREAGPPCGSAQRRAREGDRRVSRALRARQRGAHPQRRLPDAAGAHPRRVREVLPRDALITTDVGWNKNGVGQQFPMYMPGSILTPGGLATMGFGAAGGARRQAHVPRGRRRRPGGRRRLRPEPGDARDRGGIGHRGRVGGHEQLRLRHDRRTPDGALRHAFGCVFQKDGKPYSPDFAAIARAYGAEGVQIEATHEFKPALERAIASRRAVRDRRRHAERAGADRRATGTSTTSIRRGESRARGGESGRRIRRRSRRGPPRSVAMLDAMPLRLGYSSAGRLIFGQSCPGATRYPVLRTASRRRHRPSRCPLSCGERGYRAAALTSTCGPSFKSPAPLVLFIHGGS